jgi:hypothetical protein
VAQWVEELTFAVLERGAAAFIYLLAPGEVISDTTLNLWAHEVVPAVREASPNSDLRRGHPSGRCWLATNLPAWP